MGEPCWASVVLLSTWNVELDVDEQCERCSLCTGYVHWTPAHVLVTQNQTSYKQLCSSHSHRHWDHCHKFLTDALPLLLKHGHVWLWSQLEQFLFKLGQDIRLHKFCLASSWIMNPVLWKNSTAVLTSDTPSRSPLQVRISGSSARDIWTLPKPKAKTQLSILFWIWKKSLWIMVWPAFLDWLCFTV